MGAPVKAPPPFGHLTHRLHDPEEFELAVSGVRLNAEFFSRRCAPTLVEPFQAAGA